MTWNSPECLPLERGQSVKTNAIRFEKFKMTTASIIFTLPLGWCTSCHIADQKPMRPTSEALCLTRHQWRGIKIIHGRHHLCAQNCMDNWQSTIYSMQNVPHGGKQVGDCLRLPCDSRAWCNSSGCLGHSCTCHWPQSLIFLATMTLIQLMDWSSARPSVAQLI